MYIFELYIVASAILRQLSLEENGTTDELATIYPQI